MKVNKLIKNKIKCNHCGDIIESRHVHEFVAVDGGLDYAKRCYKNSLNDYIDLSEWEEVEVGDEYWED